MAGLAKLIPALKASSPPLLSSPSSYHIKITSPCPRTTLQPFIFKLPRRGVSIVACLPTPSTSSSTKATFVASDKLFVSGLSFRTSEESLRNAFQKFGELVEVNLVMDRIANRSRGFAFLRYSSDEESKKAIEEMNGKFLDGRVIFVEVAKSKTELRQELKERTQIQ